MRRLLVLSLAVLLGCPDAVRPSITKPHGSDEVNGSDSPNDTGGNGEGTDTSVPDGLDTGGSDSDTSDDTGSSDTASDSGDPPIDVDLTTLRGAAESSGRRVGAALSSSALRSDPEYVEILVREFGGVTPENAMKWGPLQPSEGEWDFTKADEMVSLALSEDLRVKGHALLWHNQVPWWLSDGIDAATLDGLMDDHFRETLTHFSTDVPDWDVVNEAFEWDGSYRESVFWDRYGEGYIADAFHRAASYAPDARLFYNDYSIERINAKSNAVADMVEAFKADGVPIHGVGLQMHVTHGSAPTRAEIKANIERFGELDVAVHISEMDVQIRHLVGPQSERFLAQAMTYYEVTSACVESAACEQLGFWGFTDRYSWIDSWYGEDDPLLYDDALMAKPARDAVHAALLGEPMAGCDASRIENGGFEEGLEGWGGMGSTLTEVDEPTVSGARAVLASDRTEAWQGPRQSVIDTIATGLEYEARAWARLTDGAAADVKLTLNWTDDSGDHWIQFATVEATSSEWVELVGTIDFGAVSVDGTLTAANVYVEGPPAGRGLYVDDVAVHPVCPVPPVIVDR